MGLAGRGNAPARNDCWSCGRRGRNVFLAAGKPLAAECYPTALERCRTGLADPWYLVSDTWVVTLVFLKDLLHFSPAGSYYRVCGFESSKRNPAVLGRGVLVTIYMTATPNAIVLGIDRQSNRLLFHQLQRTNLPKMARGLGAQP
jgi:hypothetical protein